MASSASDRDQRLQAILHDYLQAVDAGKSPDSQAIVRQHPEFAGELTAFFADQAQVARMAQAMRPALPLADAPTTGITPAAAIAPLEVIRYFGDYELLEEIARGGMGVVYKARQVKLKRVVAVKMILTGELAHATDVERFQSEARAAANLHHPNIVSIHEIGEHNGQHYFSMDYIAGESLNSRIARGPLPAREAATILAKVAQAVSFAHVAGVIHRDLKPANILLDSKNEPHVTDFGLAKRVEGEPGASATGGLTQTGQVLGTPSYMPPEQAAGKTKEIGPRADVYSLGAVLYCALTGRPPFQAASTLDTLLQVIDQDPVAPRSLNASVPLDLETICLKCLEKNPARRYASAQELADELQRFLDGQPIHARPVGHMERAWRWCRRKPAIAGLTGAVAASLIFGISVSTYFALVADARARDAETNAEVAKKEKTRAEENAEKAKASAEQALQEKDRADREAEQAQDILSRSLFEQAQALRRTTQPGRSGKALSLLREAEKLRSRARKVDVAAAEVRGAGLSAELPTQLELRNEAVASLLTQEAGLVREVQMGVSGSLPGISRDGRLVAARWLDMDLGKVGKGDLSDAKSGVQVVDLTQPDRSARWQRPLTGMLGDPAISPDNKLIASSNQKLAGQKVAALQVELRDAWSGKVAETLDWPIDDESDPPGPASSARCYFSPDGRYLAGVHMGLRKIEFALWDLKTGVARIVARTGLGNNWLLFSSDSKRLAYQPGQKTIVFWDLEKAAIAETIELPLPVIYTPVLGKDDQWLAASCKGPKDLKITILVWDLRQKAEKARFTARGAGITGVGLTGLAFRPGSSHLAFGDGNGIVVVDVEDSKEIARIDAGHKIGIAALAWQGGQRLLSASLDGVVKIWETTAAAPLRSLQPPVETMAGATFSPDGKLLGVGAAQSLNAWLINPETGAVERAFTSSIPSTEKIGFYHVYFRKDGKQLAAVSMMGKVSVWDAGTGQEVARRDAKGIIQSGVFDDRGHFLVAVHENNKVVMWDVHDHRAIWESAETPRGTTLGHLLSAGRRIVEINAALTFFDKQQFSIWDISGNKKAGPFVMEKPAMNPVFSPDGQWMAAPYMTAALNKSIGRGIELWRLSDGKMVHDIKAFPASLAFSADSKLLGVAGWDGGLTLWDVLTGREVLRGAFEARDVAFSPDGRTLALRGIDLATGGAIAKIHMLDLAALRGRLTEMGLDW